MNIDSVVALIVNGVEVKNALRKLKSDDPEYSDKDVRETWIHFLKTLVLGVWQSNYILPLHSTKADPVAKEVNSLKIMRKAIKQMERELNMANEQYFDSQLSDNFLIMQQWPDASAQLIAAFNNASAALDHLDNYLERVAIKSGNSYDLVISAMWKLSDVLSKNQNIRKKVTVEMCATIYEHFDNYRSEEQIRKALGRYLKTDKLS